MDALLRRVVEVRPEERRAVLGSFFYFFFLLTSYYILRPLREEMAVVVGVDRLPWLFSSTFGVALALSPVWTALASRMPRRRLLPLVYRFFAANLLLFLIALRVPAARSWVAPAFFVWVSVFNLYAVAVFWSFMADVFRPEQGRRLFGFIAAGGSAGALLGPLLTTALVGSVGQGSLIVLAAALLEAARWCLRAVARAAAQTPPSPQEPDRNLDDAVGGGVWSGLRAVFTSPYLRDATLYLLLTTLTATTGYFLFTRGVAATITDPIERTRMFANVDLGANLLTLILQGFVAGRLLGKIGAAATLMLLPVVSGAGLLLATYVPLVAIFTAVHMLRRSAAYGIISPTQAALFTVVSREEKYKAKAFIDTVVFRGGDVLGSWIVQGMIGAGLPTAALAAAASLPWLLVARRLGRGYRRLLDASPAR